MLSPCEELAPLLQNPHRVLSSIDRSPGGMIAAEEVIMVVNRIHLGNVVFARNLAASVIAPEMGPTRRRVEKPPRARQRWLRRVLRISLHPV